MQLFIKIISPGFLECLSLTWSKKDCFDDWVGPIGHQELCDQGCQPKSAQIEIGIGSKSAVFSKILVGSYKMFIAQEISDKKNEYWMTISSQLNVKTYLNSFLAKKISKMGKLGLFWGPNS